MKKNKMKKLKKNFCVTPRHFAYHTSLSQYIFVFFFHLKHTLLKAHQHGPETERCNRTS
jgi:hypothetical protein